MVTGPLNSVTRVDRTWANLYHHRWRDQIIYSKKKLFRRNVFNHVWKPHIVRSLLLIKISVSLIWLFVTWYFILHHAPCEGPTARLKMSSKMIATIVWQRKKRNQSFWSKCCSPCIPYHNRIVRSNIDCISSWN